uniref:RRM domain-containing protein n=1 Tax=Acrobeloides nanus TaxID=290746 RepID=A0A914BVT5_9BILA
MNQPKKIKWTTRGDGNYTTSESSDDELMEVIGKECIMKFIKTFGWLPTANESDVHKFFSEDQGFKIAQIFFHDVNGYSRGDCFIEFQNEENVKLAMRKDRQHYGERIIMVSRVDKIDYYRLMYHVEKNKSYADMSFILISGFNEKVTEKDVIEFFGEIPIEKFFLSSKTCKAFIKLKRKTDEETVLIKGHFAKLDGSFVKLQRINGVTFYELTKGMHQGEILNESKVMDENEKLQTYEAPKIDVKDWQNMVEQAHKILKIIQGMVPEDNYIIQAHVENLGNYLNMFNQKFQNDADARQNMIKEIQELRSQKKKKKSNQE